MSKIKTDNQAEGGRAASSLAPCSARSCNDCRHCLMRGELITCGKLLAEIAGDAEEGDEIDTELADGIQHTFAEECSDFQPNTKVTGEGAQPRRSV